MKIPAVVRKKLMAMGVGGAIGFWGVPLVFLLRDGYVEELVPPGGVIATIIGVLIGGVFGGGRLGAIGVGGLIGTAGGVGIGYCVASPTIGNVPIFVGSGLGLSLGVIVGFVCDCCFSTS